MATCGSQLSGEPGVVGLGEKGPLRLESPMGFR